MTGALAVAVGGAVGALARWGVTAWVGRLAGTAFPFGTMAVNVAGSFALGAAVVWIQASGASNEVRSFLTIGVLGSFTTFSAYSFEAVTLIQDGAWLRAGGYILGSVALGLAGVLLGVAAATRVT